MSDTATETKVKTRTRAKVKPPSGWTLVFHNDDYTPMDFVIWILTDFCFQDADAAEKTMLEVHNRGKARVGLYTKDVANTKATTIKMVASKNNHPLMVTVESE